MVGFRNSQFPTQSAELVVNLGASTDRGIAANQRSVVDDKADLTALLGIAPTSMSGNWGVARAISPTSIVGVNNVANFCVIATYRSVHSLDKCAGCTGSDDEIDPRISPTRGGGNGGSEVSQLTAVTIDTFLRQVGRSVCKKVP